jgi:hypothetical protein
MHAIVLVHDIPGRLRLRLPGAENGPDIASALAREPVVTSATWSPRTRSLLILYNAAAADRAALVRRVAHDAGLDGPAVLGLPPTRVVADGDNFARSVTEAFAEIDGRVRRATRGLIGLRGVMPLALVGWALGAAVRRGVAPLSWSSALWYAHGLFRDYNTRAMPQSTRPGPHA